jgi:mercuric ion transport protein
VSKARTNISPAPRRCTCAESAGANRIVEWTAAGGMLASLGICAACCLLPFALLSLGVAGAWASTLDALAPYKWVFIVLTAALLGYGFYGVYFRPKPRCAAGTECEMRGSGRSARVGLWIATILATSGLVFEHFEPMLTGSAPRSRDPLHPYPC